MGSPGRGGAEKTGNSCPRWAYFVCRSEECNDFKGLSPNAPIWPVSAGTYSTPRSGWQTEKCTCLLRSETFSASRVCLGPDHASFPMRACFQATATLALGALLFLHSEPFSEVSRELVLARGGLARQNGNAPFLGPLGEAVDLRGGKARQQPGQS